MSSNSAKRMVVLVAVAAAIPVAFLRESPESKETAPRPENVPPPPPAQVRARTPSHEPVKQRIELPEPSQWLDPLEQIGQSSAPVEHVEAAAIDPGADEEKVFADAQARFDWQTSRATHEPGFLAKSQHLRQLSLEAVRRWPGGKHEPRFRYFALRAAEFFDPLPGAGEEMWAYALAEAAARKGRKPEALVMGEIRRAAKLDPRFALAYGKILVDRAPLAKEAYWAWLEIGKASQYLKNHPAARQAYLETAKSPETYIRVAGLLGAIQLAMTRGDHAAIVQDGPALLKEDSVKPDDRRWIMASTARAYFQLKRHDEALSMAREIQKAFPETEAARDAKVLEEQVAKRIFSEASKP